MDPMLICRKFAVGLLEVHVGSLQAGFRLAVRSLQVRCRIAVGSLSVRCRCVVFKLNLKATS